MIVLAIVFRSPVYTLLSCSLVSHAINFRQLKFIRERDNVTNACVVSLLFTSLGVPHASDIFDVGLSVVMAMVVCAHVSPPSVILFLESEAIYIHVTICHQQETVRYRAKCLSVLLHGVECCPMLTRDKHSLEYTVTRAFMKLFRTGNFSVSYRLRIK